MPSDKAFEFCVPLCGGRGAHKLIRLGDQSVRGRSAPPLVYELNSPSADHLESAADGRAQCAGRLCTPDSRSRSRLPPGRTRRTAQPALILLLAARASDAAYEMFRKPSNAIVCGRPRRLSKAAATGAGVDEAGGCGSCSSARQHTAQRD